MLTQRKHTGSALVLVFAAVFVTGYQIIDKPPFMDSLFLTAAACFGAMLAAFAIVRRVPALCLKAGCKGPAHVSLKSGRRFVYTCGRCGKVDDSGVELKPEKHSWMRY